MKLNKELVLDLYSKYINGTPAATLAIEANTTRGYILHHFHKFNLKVPSQKEAVTCIKETLLTLEQKSIIEGALLGDGGLRLPKTSKNAFFRYTSIEIETINSLISLLPFDFKVYTIPSKELTIVGRKTTSKTIYQLNSNVDITLTKLYSDWYKEKKIVPDSLKLTPTSIKWWFYGDGSSSIAENKVSLCFCTNGFSIQDVEMLVRKLKEHNINFYTYITKVNQPMIKCSRRDEIQNFYSFIGKSDLECYKYKWKMPYPKVMWTI